MAATPEAATNRAEILAELQPLFNRARREKLWFRSSYQDLWFSPDELAEQQANGRFVWDLVNWILCDPNQHLETLTKRIQKLEQEYDAFRKRAGL